MPGTPTSRLSIPTIDGSTDDVSTYPDVNLAQMQIVDQFGLRPRNTTGTTRANPGDYLDCNVPSMGVILPAPDEGVLVGVYANEGIDSTSPVTINTGNGEVVISGPGVASGNNNLWLGQPLTSVVLLGDGNNWVVISGALDTGWLPLDPGQTFGGTFMTVNAAARQVGARVSVRGSITNASGTIVEPSSFVLAGLPNVLLPPEPISFPMVTNDNGGLILVGSATCSTEGGITLGSTLILQAGSYPNTPLNLVEGFVFPLNFSY